MLYIFDYDINYIWAVNRNRIEILAYSFAAPDFQDHEALSLNKRTFMLNWFHRIHSSTDLKLNTFDQVKSFSLKSDPNFSVFHCIWSDVMLSDPRPLLQG